MRPGELRPMGLVSASEVPQGDYVYQVKWDGVRMLAFVWSDRVILQNRNLVLKTAQYPELHVLSSLVSSKGDVTILDGEVVAPRPDGSTSFQAVIRRDFSTNPGSIGSLAKQIPVHYVIFDILSFDGTDVLQSSLEERLALLRKHVTSDGASVSIIEDFADGEGLFQATKQTRLEGIVAKQLGSVYLPGQRVPLWQKVKHRLRDTFPVIGYTLRDGQVNSLVIGTKDAEGEIRLAGRVGSGLTGDQISLLTRELPLLSTTEAIKGFPRGATPVHPYLLADVDFMEWTDDLVVRAPSLKGFSFGGDVHG